MPHPKQQDISQLQQIMSLMEVDIYGRLPQWEIANVLIEKLIQRMITWNAIDINHS